MPFSAFPSSLLRPRHLSHPIPNRVRRDALLRATVQLAPASPGRIPASHKRGCIVGLLSQTPIQKPRGHGPLPARYALEALRRVPPPAHRPRGTRAHNGPKGDRTPGVLGGVVLGCSWEPKDPQGESAAHPLPHFLLPPSPAGGAQGIRGSQGGNWEGRGETGRG